MTANILPLQNKNPAGAGLTGQSCDELHQHRAMDTIWVMVMQIRLAQAYFSKNIPQYNDAHDSCQCPANDYNNDSLEGS
jgi:hypothetical protein